MPNKTLNEYIELCVAHSLFPNKYVSPKDVTQEILTALWIFKPSKKPKCKTYGMSTNYWHKYIIKNEIPKDINDLKLLRSIIVNTRRHCMYKAVHDLTGRWMRDYQDVKDVLKQSHAFPEDDHGNPYYQN